jgi:S-DNA-T family DNA segregation ATPase FtsK/SpoIIIE
VLAQGVMAVVAITQKNWLFAAMVVPGVLMCATSAASSLASSREERRARAASDASSRTDPTSLQQQAAGTLSSTYSPCPGDPQKEGNAIPSLPTSSLTRLLSMQENSSSFFSFSWKSVVRNWNRTRHSFTVTIGLSGPPPKALFLNIVSQGPHALIAGTTGSGKSMFLQAWCAALALSLPPSALNFIFLDFKGGSTFRKIQKLPHVVGFVSDLNLSHAVRALRAIELELVRREKLIADAGVGEIDALPSPPPRIVVVVDEFHALRYALPDYAEHLVKIAAQGRSLGMNLILATQNPSGQVSADMKANINLNISLRVRDRYQSTEMVGSAIASAFAAGTPGVAALNDGESLRIFRSSVLKDEEEIVHMCLQAQRFCGNESAQPLFSPPLPSVLAPSMSQLADAPVSSDTKPTLGVIDDGVLTHLCTLDLSQGNLAVIGASGRGKTTVLQNMAIQLRKAPSCRVRWTAHTAQGFVDDAVENKMTDVHSPEGILSQYDSHDERDGPRRAPFHASHHGPHDRSPYRVWIVDDADSLLDPLSQLPLAKEFMQAVQNRDCRLIFSLTSARYLRYPEHCSTRLIFPSGDATADVLNGIPAGLLKEWNAQDFDITGRGVLVTASTARNIQCFPISAENALEKMSKAWLSQ